MVWGNVPPVMRRTGSMPHGLDDPLGAVAALARGFVVQGLPVTQQDLRVVPGASTGRRDVTELASVQVQLVVQRLDAAPERARSAALVAVVVIERGDDERPLDVVERGA